MIRRYRLLVIALAFAAGAASAEDPVVLLTDEEYEANLSYRERSAEIVGKRQDPLAPRIVVARPDTGVDVVAPVDVIVRFEAAGDAVIDTDSLKVKYGWFDITKRVRESMNVSNDGISGKIRSMRNGRYTISVSISDTHRRTGSAKIEFRIVDDLVQSADDPASR